VFFHITNEFMFQTDTSQGWLFFNEIKGCLWP